MTLGLANKILSNFFGMVLIKEEELARRNRSIEDLRKKLSSHSRDISYIDWMRENFRAEIFSLGASDLAISSFKRGENNAGVAHHGLFEAELLQVKGYLSEIKERPIPGDIVEFGVFQGAWIERLHMLSQEVGLERQIVGFDSFEGLPAPNPDADTAYWKEGMFSSAFEDTKRMLKVDERPHIRLVPGWFSDTFSSEEGQSISAISFARIDCDIYEPTVECLEYLAPRLSHGSYLVFDDWSRRLDKGETKAFAEWLPKHTELELEFLFFSCGAHFYFRVWHKGKKKF